MERRKLLLGSGAALATVLAGCTGSGDNGGDGGDDDDSHGDDGDGTNDEDDGKDSIPGVDLDGVDLDEHDVTIEKVSKDDREVAVEIRAKTTDKDDLHDAVLGLGKILEDGLEDPQEFAMEVDRLTVTLLDENKDPVLSFFVDVAWAIDFVENELSDEEFVDKVTDTTA